MEPPRLSGVRAAMGDRTSTGRALLIVAMQDLFDAEAALMERLGECLAALSDQQLSTAVEGYRTTAGANGQKLEKLLHALAAPPRDAPNIWMRAVLDDAARDAGTIQPGPLLDIALTGALRKGAQAARVSYETAIALMTDDARRRTLTALRDSHAAMDRRLASALSRLARDSR